MDEEKEISLQDLYEIKDRERKSKTLTKLDDEFYDIIKEKLKLILSQIKNLDHSDTIKLLKKVSKLEQKYNSYYNIYKEIILIRLKKILDSIVLAITEDVEYVVDKLNLTNKELELFWKIYNIIEEYYGDLLNIENSNKKEEKIKENIEEKKEENILPFPKFEKETRMARFVKSLDSFIWVDGVYGPIDKEDIVIFPKDLIEILSNKKVCRKIFDNL